jgi:hypothetical protein
MNKTLRNFGVTIIVLGVVALAMGVVFLGQGFSKQSYLTQTMKEENITLGMLGIKGDKADKVIDNAETAQLAGDTVREHRHAIAPNYEVALGGERFDPTNPEQLTYAQAINLENYLYLAVASFGLVTVVLATGGFMIITGLALGATGIAMIRLAQGCLNMPAE